MKPRREYGLRSRTAKYTQLALQFDGGSPPGGIPLAGVGMPPYDPSLTEKFRRAAKQPVLHDASRGPDYQKQIDLLRRQMSQPRNTFEMTPQGSVNKTINRNRDRWLQQTIDALTALKAHQQSFQKTPRQRLGLAARAGEAKRDFNHSAKGLGM